eukprot:m.35226 g.35226  ORF g.35226 m.35226 type:complete len:345 (+) comp32089_c0_seq1:614-1648(+)
MKCLPRVEIPAGHNSPYMAEVLRWSNSWPPIPQGSWKEQNVRQSLASPLDREESKVELKETCGRKEVTERKALLQKISFFDRELRKKNAELEQIKTYLDIVEKDRKSCKEEVDAFRYQTQMWKEEIETKMVEVQQIQREKDYLTIDNERLSRNAYETEAKNRALRIELDQALIYQRELEEENARNLSLIHSFQTQLAERNGVKIARPNGISIASYPQLVSHNPILPSHPHVPMRSFPERHSPSQPEILWHPKEDVDPESPSPKALAEDQYGPLQAWLRKQNMKAAFSGAYAVSPVGGPAVESYRSRGPPEQPAATRFLECPKCERNFDAGNFSVYRRHLEDCLM